MQRRPRFTAARQLYRVVTQLDLNPSDSFKFKKWRIRRGIERDFEIIEKPDPPQNGGKRNLIREAASDGNHLTGHMERNLMKIECTRLARYAERLLFLSLSHIKANGLPNISMKDAP